MSQNASNNDSPLLAGLIVGLIQGILFGILFAPKPGTQTNNDIIRFLSDLPQHLLDDQSNQLTFIKRARIKVEDGVSRVKRVFDADRQAAAKRREEQAANGVVNGMEI